MLLRPLSKRCAKALGINPNLRHFPASRKLTRERRFSMCRLRMRRRRDLHRFTSDRHDSDFMARGSDEPVYVVWVTCENRGLSPESCRHHNPVNHIRRFGYA